MILYRIDATDTRAHLFRITLTVAAPAVEQRLSLPVWIPGSYLVPFQHIGILSLEFHVDKLSRPLL